MAYLFVLNGADRCRAFQLEGDVLTIGKAPECEVQLKDPWVSWRHARLHRENGRWRIEDLGSTNGTFCNAMPVSNEALADDDVLFFGRTHALFVEGDRPPSAPPSGRVSKQRLDVSELGPEELEWLFPEDGAEGNGAPSQGEVVDAQQATTRPVFDEAERTLRIADVFDDEDPLEGEDVSGAWMGGSMGEEEEAVAGGGEVERAASPMLEESEALELSSVAGMSWTGSVSTDSVFAPPRLHGESAAGVELSDDDAVTGEAIDVADLLEPSTLERATPVDDGSTNDVLPSFAGGLELDSLVGNEERTGALSLRDQEVLRLRRLLAQRDEEIRKLREEVLRLKERYLDQ